jgi:hypothetical protein
VSFSHNKFNASCTYVCVLVSSIILVNKLCRSRTGGGPPNTIGSTEARRLGAKDFLIALKDTVGIAHYLTLVDHLKSLHLRVITIPQCRETFQFHLKEHPDLLKRFDDYLPEKFR